MNKHPLCSYNLTCMCVDVTSLALPHTLHMNGGAMPPDYVLTLFINFPG